MFGLQSLDVLIGLITIYLSLGLACTAVVEMIAAWTNLRSTNLEAALKEILEGNFNQTSGAGATPTTFLAEFYNHPLVQSLSKGKEGRPSYIPAEIFSGVVFGLLTDNGQKPIIDAINSLPGDSRIKSALLTLAQQAKGAEDQLIKNLETHFDRVMDRTKGWVKSRQQTVALIVSALLVVFGNVDTFALANALSSNPEAREKILAVAGELTSPKVSAPNAAESAIPANDPKAAIEAVKKAEQNALNNIIAANTLVQSSGLSLGWESWNWAEAPLSAKVSKVVGLIISTFAVSLGAPFWFEILQKIINIRQTGVSPREKKKQPAN